MKVNLKEIFGTDLPRDPELRNAIGQAIIDTIISRTTDENKSWDGKAFKAYSKGYKKSDNFKAFGKGNSVTLQLTGDMLGNMDIVEESRNTLDIAVDGPDAPKAFNHVTGDTLPRRDFFGLSKSEVQGIRRLFKDAVEAESRNERKTVLSGLVEQLVFLGEGNADGS